MSNSAPNRSCWQFPAKRPGWCFSSSSCSEQHHILPLSCRVQSRSGPDWSGLSGPGWIWTACACRLVTTALPSAAGTRQEASRETPPTAALGSLPVFPPGSTHLHSDAQHQQHLFIAQNINNYFCNAACSLSLFFFKAAPIYSKKQCGKWLNYLKRVCVRAVHSTIRKHIICLQIKMQSLCHLFNAISGLAAFQYNAKNKLFFLSMASSSREITWMNTPGHLHKLAAE